MTSERISNIKLGLFVLAGTALLMLGLYMLGSKRNMFSRTIGVVARFEGVSGLRSGNNVRYAGIDVGTVERITIINDTLVEVVMRIRQDAAAHIRVDAVARIASDGLMGNKIVDLEPGAGQAPLIIDGDTLATGQGVDTDAMLRSLSRSNDNVAAITNDLRDLTRRLGEDRGVLHLLTDSALATDVVGAVNEVRSAAANARLLTERANAVVLELQRGSGALGVLTTDSTADGQVRRLLRNLALVSDSLTRISGRIGDFSAALERPGSMGHALSRDTALVNDVKRVIANLDTSSATLTEDLRALQRNWFFRRYFREKDRIERVR